MEKLEGKSWLFAENSKAAEIKLRENGLNTD